MTYSATTTEEKILANLATIMATVTGIQAAYERAPLSIPEDKLPCAIVLTGAVEEVTPHGPGLDVIIRPFFVRVYGCHAEMGVSGDAESIVMPFLSRVPPILRGRPSLGTGAVGSGVPFVMDAEYQGVRDGGISILPAYSGDQYLGIEFRIRIKYMERYTYAAFQ